MTTILGGTIGLFAATGLLLAIAYSPPMRRRTIADRIAPYLLDSTAPSALLATPATRSTGTLRGLTAPLVRDLVRLIDKVIGGQASVRRRLTALRADTSVEQFRTEQVLWGGIGAAAGIAVDGVAIVTGHHSALILTLVVLAAAVGGVLARDWWLTQAVSRRHTAVLAEFPVIAEMLALAVAAGESPLGAIGRVTRLAHGHLADQLRAIVADTRAGTPLQQALQRARDDSSLEPLSRFLDGMAVAVERGTPMAEVLRAQAADVRALGKRQLLEVGGRKEILMMVPVVFLILPITILFAFFPGLVAITTVAQ